MNQNLTISNIEELQNIHETKKYWIEETDKEFILYVKFRDKNYWNSTPKYRTEMFKDNNEMKKRLVNIAILKIEADILSDELARKIALAGDSTREWYFERYKKNRE